MAKWPFKKKVGFKEEKKAEKRGRESLCFVCVKHGFFFKKKKVHNFFFLF